MLAVNITNESSTIVKEIVELLKLQPELSIGTKLGIARLLEHENKFIARTAYTFLTEQATVQDTLKDILKGFENQLKF